MKRILSYEEFVEQYNKYGRCPGDTISSGTSRRPLNENELKTRYSKYVSKEKRKSEKAQSSPNVQNIRKRDEQWEEVKAEVQKRDNQICRLLSVLNPEEQRLLFMQGMPFINKLDPAHVFGKGAFPRLKYDVDNVYTLNRYSHSMLDIGRCPLSGKVISKAEVEAWWMRIVGVDKYEELKERAYASRNQ